MTKNVKVIIGLLVMYSLYYLIPIEYRAFWQPDETRYAEISREMLASGNWIVPHFFDLRYFEKPVMGYWINNIGQWLFGHNNFAVRAGSIFSTSLTALLIGWLAFAIWRNKRIALYAIIIYLTTFLVYGIGSYAVLDPMLSLWLAAAMVSFWLAMGASSAKGKAGGFILLGFACGLGVMSKGFLALAVPVISVLPWVAAQRRWKDLFLYGPLAVIAAVVITLPWALAIARQEPDFWRYFFWVEHVQRFAEDNAQHKAPLWYYLPIVLAGTVPWLGLLPGALRLGWRGRQPGLEDCEIVNRENTEIKNGETKNTLSGDDPVQKNCLVGETIPKSADISPSADCQQSRRTAAHHGFYLLGWVVMPFLLFSLAKGKLPTYILPCFAPLAILMARYLVSARWGLRLNGWINVLFGLLGIGIILLALAPWGFTRHTLYNAHEGLKIVYGLLAFGGWALFGGLSLYFGQRRNWLAAFCPLALALLFGLSLPQQVIDAKQPQSFISAVIQPLRESRYILVNEPGIASGVAWTLKRSDIILFDRAGELHYGLQYPDAAGKLVSRQDFARWLQEHRKTGGVSLMLLRGRDDKSCSVDLPASDFLYCRGRLVYLYYQPQE